MNIKSKIRNKLLSRKTDSHKGDYGRVFILAGSRGMSGACVLTSLAALRSGAGLVTVGVPASLCGPLARRLAEAIMKPLPETHDGTVSKKAIPIIRKFLSSQDVLAVGPGLSQNSETQSVVRKLILESQIPMVIDADGLNSFKGKSDLLKNIKAPTVLTPHPGEFVRLFGGQKPKGDFERRKRALEISIEYKVVVVLKGHHTVVASPRGEIYINQTGNPGMATGGSGDVLTGIISAFLGQRLSPFDAACFGVYVHGLVGDLAAKDKGEISLIAGDLIDFLPKAFSKMAK